MKQCKKSLLATLERPLVQALLLGLSLCRWGSEVLLGLHSWLVVLAIALLLLIILLKLFSRWSFRCSWPLLFLVFYILWPSYSPMTGLAIISIVVLLMLQGNLRVHVSDWAVALLVFTSAVALYGMTLAPGLQPADSGEFQLVTQVLGIAHPPGYALYTMLGKVFSLLPLTDHAVEMNLMSAVFSSVALAVLAWVVYRVTDSLLSGIISAGVLGLGATFWVQSTTTNIRSLSTLFAVLLVVLLLEWEHLHEDSQLVLLGLLFGLAVGHHASLAFLAPPIVAFLLIVDPSLLRQPRRWLKPIGAFLVSFLVLFYLPIRSAMAPAFDPSPIDSVSAFVSHVFATGFGGDMFYYHTWPEIVGRLGIWRQIMGLELGGVLGYAAIVAFAVLVWRDWRKALLFGGIAFLNSFVAITYRAPQTVEYMLPTYVAVAFVIGIGFAPSKRAGVGQGVANVTIACLAIAVIGLGMANGPNLMLLHRDDSTRESAEDLLDDAPEGAVLLAGWHQVTPLWYLQTVEGLRPDVEIVYVYPEGAEENESVWLRRICDELDDRPVLVTNWFYAYDQSGLSFVPLTGGWLVSQDEGAMVPADALPLGVDYNEGVTLLAYAAPDVELHPGETAQLSLYWQVDKAVRQDYTLFAQLVGPEGVIAQGDHWHQTSVYDTNEVRVDVFDMPLLLQTWPGDYALVCGFYYAGDAGWTRLAVDGSDTVALQSVRVVPMDGSPETMHAMSIPFSQGTVLEGYDVDNGVDGQTRLYLHLSQSADMDVPSMLCIVSGDETLTRLSLDRLETGKSQTVVADFASGLTEVGIMLEGDGVTLGRAGAWGLSVQRPLVLNLESGDSRYVPLGGKMIYLGMQDASSDGSALILEPTFLSVGPQTHDYSVSVGVRAPDGTEIKDDGTPGLGSIPTLKWQGGWRVIDKHVLPIAELSIDGWQRILTVYDVFTLQSLAVLDDRLVREGQGITLLDGVVFQ